MANVLTLLNAVTASGAGTASEVETKGPRNVEAPVQAVLTGTATVVLQGSLDNTNWVDVATFTASGAQLVTLFPYMRGNVTSYSSGAVTLKLLAKVPN